MPDAEREQLDAALSDRYRIERELGRGGMATVYLARDLRHERLVALKVLRPDLGALLGPERFTREIKLAAALQHPHIVAVYDSGATPAGQLWFTMPYIEGESLLARLDREKQLPVGDALMITKEVADTVDYAPPRDHPPRHRAREHSAVARPRAGGRLRRGTRDRCYRWGCWRRTADADRDRYCARNAHLFPAPGDPTRHWSRAAAERKWVWLAKRAGLPTDERYGWHSLRRQFATELKHIPLTDLCALGGSKSSQTILTCYQQPDERTQRTALAHRKLLDAGGLR